MKKANSKLESVEQLNPEIEKQIEGAKEAVQYFNSMLNANEAMKLLIKSQLEYAESELVKLEKEYERKHLQPAN
jgi:chromosome segregation ATPase